MKINDHSDKTVDIFLYNFLKNNKKDQLYSLGFILLFFFFAFLFTFLHAIWKLQIRNQGLFFALWTIVTHEITFITINLIMIVLYSRKPKIMDQFQVITDDYNWNINTFSYSTILSVLPRILLNHCITFPIVFLPFVSYNICPFSVSKESFPNPIKAILNIIFFIFICELWYYWMNRLVHSYPNILNFLQRDRRNLQEEEYSFYSDAQHPIYYLIFYIIPINLGPFLLGERTHLSTYLVWISYIVIFRNEIYSGYNFPWSIVTIIPYTANTEYHVYNRKYGDGNFGFFFAIFDAVCGTMSKEYKQFLSKQYKFSLNKQN